MNTTARGDSPLLEAQISDAFASVDTRDGAGEKGGESQYRLKERSAMTEIAKIKYMNIATYLIKRLIRETKKGEQAK